MRRRAVKRPLPGSLLGLTVSASFAVACSGADAPTLPPGPPAPVLCNGSTENCQRRYDQVTFAATHNAFSYAAGGPVHYVYPNQDRPITSQLQSGIRGFGIRPCPYYGDDPAEVARVYVTHNFELRGLLERAQQHAAAARSEARPAGQRAGVRRRPGAQVRDREPPDCQLHLRRLVWPRGCGGRGKDAQSAAA